MGRTRKMEGKSKRQADRIRSEQQCDGRSDSQKSPPSAVNFDLLDYDVLERLAIHYGIQPYYTDRRALVHAVYLGFNSEQVSENEALTAFLSKELFQGKWRSISKATRAITSKVPSRTKLLKKRVREATYNEMIQGALQRLPGQQGTLEEIYYVIEQRHSRTLNFECEAGSRRIPVIFFQCAIACIFKEYFKSLGHVLIHRMHAKFVCHDSLAGWLHCTYAILITISEPSGDVGTDSLIGINKVDVLMGHRRGHLRW